MKVLWKHLRGWITAVVAIAVVLLAMMWLSGILRSRQKPIPTPAALGGFSGETTTVARVSRPHQAEIVGTVQAEIRTTISARLVANIVELKKRAGDPVAEGEVLVRLDDRDMLSRVKQAEDARAAAIPARDLAQKEIDRISAMLAKNVGTQSELDPWLAKLAAAKADISRADQQVNEANVALSDTIIRAPFKGIVIDRLAEPGEQASPGKPLLLIYDPSRLRVEASVREAHISFLKRKRDNSQEVPIFIDTIGQERKATVQEIVPAADPGSRSFLVKLPLADSTDLFPGMFARVRLDLDPEDRLVIPAKAVSNVGQLSLVQVVSEGKAQRRYVRLGQSLGDRVEVLAGLREGESVVISGR